MFRLISSSHLQVVTQTRFYMQLTTSQKTRDISGSQPEDGLMKYVETNRCLIFNYLLTVFT